MSGGRGGQGQARILCKVGCRRDCLAALGCLVLATACHLALNRLAAGCWAWATCRRRSGHRWWFHTRPALCLAPQSAYSFCCFAQVEGCGRDLAEEKDYYRRYKVCQAHASDPCVIVRGSQQRFCQQCGTFHGVSEFDLDKR